MAYLVLFLGTIALMDGYISGIKSTAIPSILREYGIDTATFSELEALALIPTFFVVAFNGMADRLGRRPAMLLLILGLGLPCLAIVLWTPTLPWFFLFYGAATFFTVSNLWNVPVNEEAPAARRGRLAALVYAAGQLPLAALLPPLLVGRLGLDWRWMYGAMALLILPVLLLWLPLRESGRIAYVAGPALAAVLLRVFPTMTGFWVAAGLVMLVPVAIVWLADPLETRGWELEELETML